MYSTTGVGVAYTAGAGEMKSTTGSGVANTVDAGAAELAAAIALYNSLASS